MTQLPALGDISVPEPNPDGAYSRDFFGEPVSFHSLKRLLGAADFSKAGDRNAGLSKTKDSHLFVSRGCGFVGPPTRIGSPPEVVKIVLLAG